MQYRCNTTIPAEYVAAIHDYQRKYHYPSLASAVAALAIIGLETVNSGVLNTPAADNAKDH